MPKMIFVNLPVRDLTASTAFYKALGGKVNPQFSGDKSSCMVLSDTIFVMLLTHEHYRQFTQRPIVLRLAVGLAAEVEPQHLEVVGDGTFHLRLRPVLAGAVLLLGLLAGVHGDAPRSFTPTGSLSSWAPTGLMRPRRAW